jgi:hypothetical protein
MAAPRSANPDEFAVFDLVAAGLPLSAAAARLGLSATDAGNAFRSAQAKLLHAMRADPIYQLIKATLEAERTTGA